MFKNSFYKWILLVVFGFFIQISATFSDYQVVFEDRQFLTEGIFQILESDLDQDGQSEMVLVGKNYIGRELYGYWLTGDPSFKPVVKWQSKNLYEDRSNLWAVTGKFESERNQLMILTSTKFYLYQAEQGQLTEIGQEEHLLDPLNVSCGDLNGDGRNELVVARIGKITSKIYNGVVQVWQLNQGKLEMLAESGLIGNIRGLTVGDLDGDGKSEIYIEEGYQMESGNIHVLTMDSDKLTERFSLKKVSAGAIYSMRVKKSAEGARLITGSTRGKLNVFAWENNSLVKTEKETSFTFGLVDLEHFDLDHDGQAELLLVGYPQRLQVLAQKR